MTLRWSEDEREKIVIEFSVVGLITGFELGIRRQTALADYVSQVLSVAGFYQDRRYNFSADLLELTVVGTDPQPHPSLQFGFQASMVLEVLWIYRDLPANLWGYTKAVRDQAFKAA